MWFAGFISGAVAASLILFTHLGGFPGYQNDCRAANPGYECRLTWAWVRGEAFQ